MVDFICPGASRSGTTSLQWLLEQHPGVFVPPEKELTFFYDDQRYARGRSFYESFFAKATSDQVIGEISPPYFHAYIRLNNEGKHLWSADDSAARLKQDYPEAKIIITLRDPVKRMHSQFWKAVLKAPETAQSLGEAVEEELAGQRPADQTPFCWVYKNRYKTHIQRWQELFGPHQVLVTVFEEWIRQPLPFVRRLEDFLGLQTWPEPPHAVPQKNPGRRVASTGLEQAVYKGASALGFRSIARRFGTQEGHPPLESDVARRLYEELKPDLDYVDQLTGGLASRHWGL